MISPSALHCDTGAADDDGLTALHFAARKGTPEIVQILLEAGAAVDPCDKHGNTPLFTAVFNFGGRGDIIELLRRAGADPMTANAHGVSPPKLSRTIANCDVRQFFIDLPEERRTSLDRGPRNSTG